MAKTGEITLTPAEEELYLKALRIENRYTSPIVNKKDITYSRRSFKELVAMSKFEECAILWEQEAESLKTAWDNAGAVCGLTGWELFLQDTTYRLENGLVGTGSPNLLRQYKVLKIGLNSAAIALSADQWHSSPYYLAVRNEGQKNAFTPVEITETPSFPFTWGFNYQIDITKKYAYSAAYARLYMIGREAGSVVSQYNYMYFPLVSGWTQFEEVVDLGWDEFYYYYLRLYFYYCDGTVFIDNLRFEYDSQNWAIDKNCDLARPVYRGALAECRPPWYTGGVSPADFFDSVYFNQ